MMNKLAVITHEVGSGSVSGSMWTELIKGIHHNPRENRQGQDHCTMQPEYVAARRRTFGPSSKEVSAQANLIKKISF
jgi:hypothetical protein